LLQSPFALKCYDKAILLPRNVAQKCNFVVIENKASFQNVGTKPHRCMTIPRVKMKLLAAERGARNGRDIWRRHESEQIQSDADTKTGR